LEHGAQLYESKLSPMNEISIAGVAGQTPLSHAFSRTGIRRFTREIADQPPFVLEPAEQSFLGAAQGLP
jgi:hypothetical protein